MPESGPSVPAAKPRNALGTVVAKYASRASRDSSAAAHYFDKALTFDPGTERILGDPEAAALVRREYRKDHWAVPKG